LVVPTKVVATEEHHVVGDNVLPTNQASSLYKESHVQATANRAYVPCNMLLCTIDGAQVEENTC
jgi:hypothetical protein